VNAIGVLLNVNLTGAEIFSLQPPANLKGSSSEDQSIGPSEQLGNARVLGREYDSAE
jgi:hypothetical protein